MSDLDKFEVASIILAKRLEIDTLQAHLDVAKFAFDRREKFARFVLFQQRSFASTKGWQKRGLQK